MSHAFVRQLVALSLLALATPFAAAQTRSDLIGSWEAVRVLNADGEETTDSDDAVTMTFTEDGRLLIRLNDTPGNPRNSESIKASYSVEADALVLLNETGDEQRLFYRFEGDELVLSPDFATRETAYLRRIE
ncbi:MAG: hypothetical protein Rubg2KO_08910 [Rubricoccaceae bacterium]